MELRHLSHVIGDSEPNWPDAPGLRLHVANSRERGDLAYTHVIEIYSHYGTHVDIPIHFVEGGRAMHELCVDDFVFAAPLVVDLPLEDEELILPGHLEPWIDAAAGADLLIFRSGFERNRPDRERYELHGPGFSSDAATVIRTAMPTVRSIALDWLSLAAIAHLDEGVAAHKILLGEDDEGRFVSIFEDVRVSGLEGSIPQRVFALPLFIEGLDGSPCTIVAEV